MGFTGRHRLIGIAIAGVVSVGVIGGAAVAIAQSPGSTPSSDQSTTSVDMDLDGHHGKIVHAGLKEILDASGLTQDQVKQGFAAGKSLNQLITDNHGDPVAVQAKVLSDLDAKLKDLVGKGTITQAQSDKIAARANTELPKLMDHAPKVGDHAPKAGPGPHLILGGLDAAAKAIGITPQELMAQLKDGKTIADAAKAKGVDPQKVIDAIVADETARIDKLVTDGKLDSTKAEKLKSTLKDAITKFVNDGGPHFGMHGRGGPGFRQGGPKGAPHGGTPPGNQQPAQ